MARFDDDNGFARIQSAASVGNMERKNASGPARASLLLAIGAVLALGSCGGTDVGVTGDEILIGTWAPLTGPASNLATIAKAMEAYFRYVNEEEGGVHGRKLRLLVKDDAYDPAKTPKGASGLVGGERGFGLLGGTGRGAGDHREVRRGHPVRNLLALGPFPRRGPGRRPEALGTGAHAHQAPQVARERQRLERELSRPPHQLRRGEPPGLERRQAEQGGRGDPGPRFRLDGAVALARQNPGGPLLDRPRLPSIETPRSGSFAPCSSPRANHSLRPPRKLGFVVPTCREASRRSLGVGREAAVMKFGKVLRKLREEKNISIARFARSVGMSPTYPPP